MAKMWAGRFQKETDAVVNDFNSSVPFDCRMYAEDISGSIAHATMLGHQGIIPMEDVELAASAYGISGSMKPVENILRTIRMNRLTTILTMTASWCNGNNKTRTKHPKTWESFAAVYKATFEEV